MRTVIILSLLVFLVASTAVTGVEPVSVGGDFGQSWLKNLPYQPETSAEDGGGLWSWGGAPQGATVVNNTLQPVVNGTGEVDFAGIAWLGSEPMGQPVALNETEVPVEMAKVNFLSPFYSDDPWILAQHYERPVRAPANWFDEPEDE